MNLRNLIARWLFLQPVPRGPRRPKITKTVEVPSSFFPKGNCVNTTIGLDAELQRHVWKELEMASGDTLILTDGDGRTVTGELLIKPTDCVLVRDDTAAD